MNPDEPNKFAAQYGKDKEPTVGSRSVPVTLILVLGVLIYWSQLYLDGHAGGFSRDVYSPYDSAGAVAAANPQNEGDKITAIGRDIFNKNCSQCHQLNGLGQEGKAPPLVGSEWVLASSADRIARIPLWGLTGPITVKGQEWGLTMPTFADNYTDEQFAAVLTFIRTKLGDNHASVVSPALIKAARAEKHLGPETADELLKIPLQ
jgi:mono/diheme cytochrome c family protein